MILETLKQLDIQRVGDLDDGIKAGISQESLPFIFELVSKQLYSNPIGSVIREITSNCFDSHIEAGVDEPVIISKTYDADEGYSIEFQDVGVGISPDRIQNIYMNYFSSTKRDNNEQHGGFGIGSKTPLAYADLFYITTVYGGKEYQYLFHKGESKPTLESLLGYDEEGEEYTSIDEETEETVNKIRIKKIPIGEDTDKHNGTTIKVIMEDKDTYTFLEQLKFQLAYFDSVYFKGWNISNHYDIYEGKYFKFRSDINPNYTETHICIGKVRYEIDFTKVKISQSQRDVPIAIKFEIGELQITPSREALRYTDKTIHLIEERVKLAIQELVDMFNKQNPIVEDLNTFVELNKEIPKVTFDNDKGHYLYLKKLEGTAKNFKFKPLADIEINKTPQNLFFMWECVGAIFNGKRERIFNEVDNEFITKKKYLILTDEDRDSTYTFIKIGQDYSSGRVLLIKRKEVDYNEVVKGLGLTKAKLGKAKIISKFIQVITKIVHENGDLYSDHKPSPEWIRDYKKTVKEQSAEYKRKLAKKVFVRDLAHSWSGDISINDLEKGTGIVIYGLKGDSAILSQIATTVMTCRPSIYNYKRTKRIKTVEDRFKRFRVLQVSQSVELSLIKLKNKKVIYWEEFFSTKFFKKLCTARHIHNTMINLQISRLSLREVLIKDFEGDHNKVYEVINKEYRAGSFCLSDRDTGDYIPSMMIPLTTFIEKHTYYIPLIESIESSITYNETDPDFIELTKYLIYKKIRLKNKYYLKLKNK